MIAFNKEVKVDLEDDVLVKSWIANSIDNEGFRLGEINFVFVSDDELLDKNIKYLKHNTLTDVISFDYTMGKLISGDVFISVDRVRLNAVEFKESFSNELRRVMIHGVLHFCGYKDKVDGDKKTMKKKENFYLDLINF